MWQTNFIHKNKIVLEVKVGIAIENYLTKIRKSTILAIFVQID